MRFSHVDIYFLLAIIVWTERHWIERDAFASMMSFHCLPLDVETRQPFFYTVHDDLYLSLMRKQSESHENISIFQQTNELPVTVSVRSLPALINALLVSYMHVIYSPVAQLTKRWLLTVIESNRTSLLAEFSASPAYRSPWSLRTRKILKKKEYMCLIWLKIV